MQISNAQCGLMVCWCADERGVMSKLGLVVELHFPNKGKPLDSASHYEIRLLHFNLDWSTIESRLVCYLDLPTAAIAK